VSTPLNNVKVERFRISGVPVNLATSFNSGDMMKWDPVNRVATPTVAGDAGANSAASNFIGVSNDTNPIPSIKQNLAAPRITIITSGLVQFNVGDLATYFPGDLVAIGNDPQVVTKSNASAANAIGVVAAENFFTVTSGATVGIVAPATIQVYLRPQFTSLTPV